MEGGARERAVDGEVPPDMGYNKQLEGSEERRDRCADKCFYYIFR